MKKVFKAFLWTVGLIALTPFAAFLAVYFNYQMISFSVRDKMFAGPELVPYRTYGLVMGAGNYEPGYWINPAFNHRMISTYNLFQQGKVDSIIVSGKLVPGDYDEPAEMKTVLIEMGVPAGKIISDYGGLRTWASVERAKMHFKIDSIIIISQHDQLERALFIARFIGLDAIGLEAESHFWHHRFWTIREYLARVKCIFDCVQYIFT